jgi:hypothetical protein
MPLPPTLLSCSIPSIPPDSIHPHSVPAHSIRNGVASPKPIQP